MELAIRISYPTSASGITVLLKTPKRISIFELPAVFVDAYDICGQWYMNSYTIAC